MEYTLIQKAEKDLIYYGVYNTRAELIDDGDVLCSVRKNFFESGKRQKNRSTFNIAGEMIRASYMMEAGRPLKWKKMIGSRLAERITIRNNCYIVESLDSDRRVYKKAYFDEMHRWLSSEYFLNAEGNLPECTFVPSNDGDKPIIIVKTQNNSTEMLYPFETVLDKELTEKLNEVSGEPQVLCKTSSGTFYFCTKEEAEVRQKLLKRMIEEKEQPDSDEELIDSGFDVNMDALAEESAETSISEEAAVSVEAQVMHEIIPGLPEEKIMLSESKESADANGMEEASPDTDEVSDSISSTDVRHDEAENIDQPEQTEEAQIPVSAEIDDLINVDEGTAENHDDINDKNMMIREFSFTADTSPLYEESITGAEAGVIAEDGSMCAFAGQCPYENIDKLIIESGGKQYFYFGETDGDNRHGNGRTAMFDGKTAYEGSYRNDKRDGFGVYYYKSGKLCYVGSWEKNRREGLGAAFSSGDGSVFVGKWHDNEPIAAGAGFDRDGRLNYVGKTKEGKRNGTGITYSEETDAFFVGKYQDGEFMGRGTQFDGDGNLLYSGAFSGGQRNGEGVSYHFDGSVKYKGFWQNDLYHGEGTLYLDDGCILKGSFRCGKANGTCTLTDASGRVVYSGGFSDDLYNGAGRLYSDNGSYAEGRFADGEPTGIFNEYSRKGELLYCGEWTDMQRNGKGVAYKHGEKLYEGDFSGGLYHGQGKLYDNGEPVYIGTFSEGRISGFGTELNKGETVYTGMWEDGSYSGCGILYEDGHPKFAGVFKESKREGRINEISDNRIVRKCIYENDQLVYMCEYDSNGSILYYGNVKDDKRSGMGCSFNDSCEKEFEGIFKNGKPDKAMSVFYKELDDLPECNELQESDYSKFSHAPEYAVELSYSGGIYTGQVRSDKPEGRGTILYFDHRYTGMFQDGEPCGSGVIYMRDGSEIEGVFSPVPTSSCETLIFTNLTYYREEK